MKLCFIFPYNFFKIKNYCRPTLDLASIYKTRLVDGFIFQAGRYLVCLSVCAAAVVVIRAQKRYTRPILVLAPCI